MIMTAQDTLGLDANEDGMPDDDLKSTKDKYLGGLLGSNEELFREVVSSTDFELAGHDARIVTIRGAMQGLSTTTKLVYFMNLDSGESTPTVRTIMFGQSDNVQFDCSADFAKTIASAMPA